MISRCSSPMPEMRVCPLSSSVRTLKVGSSCCELVQRAAELVLVGLAPGSIAIAITGSGNSIDSSTIGLLRVAQGVAGAQSLQPDRGGDVAGARPP